jgi:hypothetical protein
MLFGSVFDLKKASNGSKFGFLSVVGEVTYTLEVVEL